MLVALSLFFYSTWNPWYCLPLTVTALLDYNTSWLLVRTTERAHARLADHGGHYC